jgi:hypothetical protein
MLQPLSESEGVALIYAAKEVVLRGAAGSDVYASANGFLKYLFNHFDLDAQPPAEDASEPPEAGDETATHRYRDASEMPDEETSGIPRRVDPASG